LGGLIAASDRRYKLTAPARERVDIAAGKPA